MDRHILEVHEKRTGWNFKWLSSFGTVSKKAFHNFTIHDPQGTQQSGITVFFEDSTGSVFHTYSTYSRGTDLMNAAYNYLDFAPKGRDEDSQTQYCAATMNTNRT